MLLGLDLGTTNVKALVTDLAGRALGEGACGVRLFQLGNGGVSPSLCKIPGKNNDDHPDGLFPCALAPQQVVELEDPAE